MQGAADVDIAPVAAGRRERRGPGAASDTALLVLGLLVLGSDPAQRLTAADLVQRHAESDWRPLMLAVDLGGATVAAHSALEAEPA